MRLTHTIIEVMEHEQNTDLTLINYRLEAIENSLAEVKSLLVDVPRLADRVTLCEKQSTENKDNIEKLEKEIQDIKVKPIKKDAQKWQYILDFIFKSFVAAAAVYFLSKIGIKA